MTLLAHARDRHAQDDGQIAILIVFFAIIIAALITAVVDVSTVFLAQRELQSVADGAALNAAQQPNIDTVYGAGLGGQLPLSSAQVHDSVATYAANAARIPHECHAASFGVRTSQLLPDGQTVAVTMTCTVPLPFVNVVSRLWSKGVTINESAHARSPVVPGG